MERFPALTRTRLKQLAGDMKALIYPAVHQVDKLVMAGPTERISYDEATKLKYKPVKLGQQLGPQWSTFWFQIEASVPAEWAGQRVDLLWNSLSEAQLWIDGKPIQGLNLPYGERPDALLTQKASAQQKFSFYVEMACNTSYGVWLEPKSPHAEPFSLERCELGLFDPLAYSLYLDFVVLQELEVEMSTDNAASDMPFAGKLLFELNRFANEYDLTDKTTWNKAHKILKDLYKAHNPTVTHTSYAVGHGHLDTAWLWPIAETYRKCLRTWTNQLAIMDAYDDYKFACSAAFHYHFMKDKHPEIYKRVKQKAKSGQWIPVGGTWIEPDCNLPSGESLARQFLFGQRFFEKEFGQRCREFFNPDVFGYCGQLPQIMKLSAIDHFITSKLHENELNKPKHHTFIWQGIDGSEIITHFPPLRFFTVPVTVADMRNVFKRFTDHDFSNTSVILYGHGDGGGGPTKEMVERLRRYQDLQGIPKAHLASPQSFFDTIVPIADRLPKQVGEIYFEYHRGTYTSQAWIKKANRKTEFLLHNIEFLASVALKTKKTPYPEKELQHLWQLLLLNQMHDILPGSSIELVYKDAAKDFAELESAGSQLEENALLALTDIKMAGPKDRQKLIPINTTSFARQEISQTANGELAVVQAPSYGIGEIIDYGQSENKKLFAPPTITEKSNKIILENTYLKATFNHGGDLISLIEKTSGRESLSAPGNRLQVFSDKPAVYDAWQLELYHLETVKDCPPADNWSISTKSNSVANSYQSRTLAPRQGKSPTSKTVNTVNLPDDNGAVTNLRAEIKFERKIGKNSSMTQTVRLDAGSRRLEFHCHVDWHEAHKVLKVLFPTNVQSMEATYDTQFGSLHRPTHFNTTHDMAKFEVCAHKWADLSEHGFGVALLTESKYGYSVFDNEMRVTLLRSPKLPDSNADMGEHHFSYAIMPHTGSWQKAGVVAEAYKFNVPIVWGKAAADNTIPQDMQSYFSINDPNLVIETIKKAEDSSAIVVRLYECHGARGIAKLKTSLPFNTAHLCNLLEDDAESINIEKNEIEIPYTPFQIISLKLN
jgi:alpha-mannosidase